MTLDIIWIAVLVGLTFAGAMGTVRREVSAASRMMKRIERDIELMDIVLPLSQQRLR
jgi:hypothetical protein